jgi:hypothetical protein
MDEYDNGEPYYPLGGQEICAPPRFEQRPWREFLECIGISCCGGRGYFPTS